jgi:ABC-type microcin C transport system permease subunit YejB
MIGYALLMSEQIFEMQEQKAKDLAIASLAVSVSCIFVSAGLLSFIGSIIGHIALGKLKAIGNTSHTGFAMAGIIIGYVSTALFFVIMIGIFAFIALDSSIWY